MWTKAPIIQFTRDDPRWPTMLNALDQVKTTCAPTAINVMGDLPTFERSVAIVGTRAASAHALSFTEALAFELAQAECTIVSGGARGIDAAAHRGALNAGKATVAVLGSALQKPYPKHHLTLFKEIIERGALVSEYPDPNAPMFASNFLNRNRLIAALAKIVIVVEAPEKSGALSTAAWARQLGLPICSVPSSPWNYYALGSLGLLKHGAQICTSAQDVLSIGAMNPQRTLSATAHDEPTRPKRQALRVSLSPQAKQLLSLVNKGVAQVDELVQASGLGISETVAGLTELSLAGYVHEPLPGQYTRQARGRSFV